MDETSDLQNVSVKCCPKNVKELEFPVKDRGTELVSTGKVQNDSIVGIPDSEPPSNVFISNVLPYEAPVLDPKQYAVAKNAESGETEKDQKIENEAVKPQDLVQSFFEFWSKATKIRKEKYNQTKVGETSRRRHSPVDDLFSFMGYYDRELPAATDYVRISHTLKYVSQMEDDRLKIMLKTVMDDFSAMQEKRSEFSTFYRKPGEVLYSNTEYFPESQKVKEGHHFLFCAGIKIGEGGFGTVFAVVIESQNNLHKMALKKSKPKNVTFVEHLRKLGSHPYLLLPDVVIYNNELMYQIMEEGVMSLWEVVNKTKLFTINESQVCKIYWNDILRWRMSFRSLALCQITQGVLYLHEMNLIHQDLKLQNCVVMKGFQYVKIIDFDFLAHCQSGSGCGTRSYHPPEVFSGESKNTKAGEIFTLGLVIAELFGFDIAKVFRLDGKLRTEECLSQMESSIGKSSKELAALFKAMAKLIPSDRPNIKEVHSKVKQIYPTHDVWMPPHDLMETGKGKNDYHNWLDELDLPRLPPRKPDSLKKEFCK